MDVHVIDGVRTPHGSFLGGLSEASAVDLGETAVSGLLDRATVDPGSIDWLCLGNAIQAGVGQVPAHQVGLAAGLPTSLPATTVNEASGSGLRAIALAADRIEAGRADLAVAGGTESMSNAPFLVRELRRGRRHGDSTLVDAMIHDSLWDATVEAHMGELTEELADRFDVGREAQDRLALASHRRATAAIEAGEFDDEVVRVDVDGRTVELDEGPRPDTSLEALADLPPAFDQDGTVTAGNASNLSDGAGCVLVGSGDAADAASATPMARIVDYVVAYRDPEWFGMAVADAVEALLDVNDLAVSDVDVFELNEAFAAQMVYARHRLGIPDDVLNPRGGAIALGHPIGASGGILTTTLVHMLVDEGDTRGIVGMSVGGGGGIALLLERSA